jgi:regulator of RNase E activity RraA
LDKSTGIQFPTMVPLVPAVFSNALLGTTKRGRATIAVSRLKWRYMSSSTANASLNELLKELRCLDTACLCDADKSLLEAPEVNVGYEGLKLLERSIRPLNSCDHKIMAGVTRTVQCAKPNDFLAVLRGLDEAQQDEILVVNTMSSHRAVAGELFCAEAERKGLGGIVVDGPMRDTAYLESFSVRCFASSISPYSGTIQSVGTMQVTITCGGVAVSPGEILVGDDDGIVVASLKSFQVLLPVAKAIHDAEEKIRKSISDGTDLVSLTNFKEHLDLRLAGKSSALEFRVD